MQRDRLIQRVAQSLAWSGLAGVDQDTHLRRARRVVMDLEGIAVHGATDKRAAEAALTAVIERTA